MRRRILSRQRFRCLPPFIQPSSRRKALRAVVVDSAGEHAVERENSAVKLEIHSRLNGLYQFSYSGVFPASMSAHNIIG
jgi:hypothetical protein